MAGVAEPLSRPAETSYEVEPGSRYRFFSWVSMVSAFHGHDMYDIIA
jgi:hypothetical protein